MKSFHTDRELPRDCFWRPFCPKFAPKTMDSYYPNRLSIGDASVEAFVGEVTQVVVANFHLAALRSELKAQTNTIANELDVQRAVLTIIRD